MAEPDQQSFGQMASYSHSEYPYFDDFKNYDDNAFVGGKTHIYPNPRSEPVVRVLVGNSVGITLRNRVSSWKAFKGVYKTEVPSDKILNGLVSDFLGYDVTGPLESTEGDSKTEKYLTIPELNAIFESIFKSNLKITILRSFKIYQPISSAIRSVFMLYKDHIEELLLKFDAGLAKLNGKKSQIPDLMTNWREINKKYKIGSSSKLILFLFPPKSPSMLPNLAEKYVKVPGWHPKIELFDWSTKDKKMAGLISKFRDEIKSREFLYLGFCPKRPVFRLTALMNFPTDALLDCLNYMDIETRDYTKLHTKLKVIRLPKPTTAKFEFATEKAIGDGLEKLYSHIDNLLETCKKNLGTLHAYDKYCVSVADEFIVCANHLKRFVYKT